MKLHLEFAQIKWSPSSLLVLLYGLSSLILFVMAVGLMNYRLFFALDRNLVNLNVASPWLFNSLLLLQFPIIHSLFLGKWRKYLSFGLSGDLAKKASITNYTILASLQLLLVFGLWQFTDHIWFQPSAAYFYFSSAIFLLFNLYLGKAMYDAGLGIQIGFSGWLSILKNEAIKFPQLPTQGTFKYCRQPIYFSFFLLLWASPYWSIDKLILALGWSLYCFIGPIFKERRFLKHFGESFKNYRNQTPYFIPTFKMK